MKVYCFSDTNWQARLNLTVSDIVQIITQISSDTCTVDLILALYLLSSNSGSGGIAYVRNWLTPKHFASQRGRWRFTKKFPPPNDLPEKYKLIRLQFGINYLSYPLSQQDCYGWTLTYHKFQDHLAFLFSHELHHFRRFHLGFHTNEGENTANKWSIHLAQDNNFQVSGSKSTKRKTSGCCTFLRSRGLSNRYSKFRELAAGDRLIIKYDPQGRYQNSLVTVIRPIRTNSRRIVVQTEDGKHWRWPMDWIALSSQLN